MRRISAVSWLAPLLVQAVLPASAYAQDPLETETARFYKQGTGKVVDTFEIQKSKEGSELAIPIQIEYGITDRLELLLEPSAYTSIRPKNAPNATDFGDLEITLSYLLVEEEGSWPAIALAAELKLPLAKDPLIGTGEPDYTLILVGSRKFGDWDVHANIGYSLLGRGPLGGPRSSFNFAVATVLRLDEKFDFVAEVVGGISASSEGASAAAAGVPEAAGEEGTVFMIGGRYYFREKTLFSLGLGIDDNNAALLRMGLTFKY